MNYGKYGTRVCLIDEEDESLRDFVFWGTKALAEANGWTLLHGCFQRAHPGRYAGDETIAYLWPVVRDEAGAPS